MLLFKNISYSVITYFLEMNTYAFLVQRKYNNE